MASAPSSLKAGLAYLPFIPAVLATTVVTQQAVARTGTRPLLITGRDRGRRDGLAVPDYRAQHVRRRHARPGDSPRGRLGPLFVLIFLAGLVKVRDNDAGVASSLVNAGQQVGGSIGLAVIGTVAWSAVASSLRSPAAAAARAGVHATGARAAALQTQMYDHALATRFSRGYLFSAGVLALAAITALAMIRVSRQDLSGADPAPELRRGPGPGTGR